MAETHVYADNYIKDCANMIRDIKHTVKYRQFIAQVTLMQV
jgi:hypothetical protein